MGGDFGPKATVPGALQAAREFDVDILLVGLESAIRRELERHETQASRVTIVDAPEAIGMGEGILSFRKKKASSIRVGAQLVKDGRADAFVSMGNTAAVVYISPRRPGGAQGRGPAGPGPARPRASRARPSSSTSGPTPTASRKTSSSSPSWARSSWRPWSA